MVTVAVGGFDDEVIGLVDVLRVAENRLVEVSDIAGKDDLLLTVVFPEPDLDGRRAQKMPDVGKAYRNRFVDLYLA